MEDLINKVATEFKEAMEGTSSPHEWERLNVLEKKVIKLIDNHEVANVSIPGNVQFPIKNQEQ